MFYFMNLANLLCVHVHSVCFIVKVAINYVYFFQVKRFYDNILFVVYSSIKALFSEENYVPTTLN